MSKDTKRPTSATPNPDVEVVNPRYEGATPIMVAKALLQRPKKDEKASDQAGEPQSAKATADETK